MSRAIPLLPLWAFVTCSRVNFTLIFTLPWLLLQIVEHSYSVGIGPFSHGSKRRVRLVPGLRMSGDVPPSYSRFVHIVAFNTEIKWSVLQVIICLFVFTVISLNGVLHFISATNERLRLSELKSKVVNASWNVVVAIHKYTIVTLEKATRPYFGRLHVMTGGFSSG